MWFRGGRGGGGGADLSPHASALLRPEGRHHLGVHSSSASAPQPPRTQPPPRRASGCGAGMLPPDAGRWPSFWSKSPTRTEALPELEPRLLRVAAQGPRVSPQPLAVPPPGIALPLRTVTHSDVLLPRAGLRQRTQPPVSVTGGSCVCEFPPRRFHSPARLPHWGLGSAPPPGLGRLRRGLSSHQSCYRPEGGSAAPAGAGPEAAAPCPPRPLLQLLQRRGHPEHFPELTQNSPCG